MYEWYKEVIPALLVLGGGIKWLFNFLTKKFKEKEDIIKELRDEVDELRDEKQVLEINNVRMEAHLVKKSTKSRGKNK